MGILQGDACDARASHQQQQQQLHARQRDHDPDTYAMLPQSSKTHSLSAMIHDLDLLILGPRSNNNSKPRPTTMKPRGAFSIFDEHHDALTRASGKQNPNAPPPNTMPPQRPGTSRANIRRRRAPPVQPHCDDQEKHVASHTTRCKTPLSGAVRVLQATSRVVDRVGSGGGKENVPPGCEGVSAEKLGWERETCSKTEVSVSVGVRDRSTPWLRTVEEPQLDRRIAMRAPQVVVSSLTDCTPQTARQDLGRKSATIVLLTHANRTQTRNVS